MKKYRVRPSISKTVHGFSLAETLVAVAMICLAALAFASLSTFRSSHKVSSDIMAGRTAVVSQLNATLRQPASVFATLLANPGNTLLINCFNESNAASTCNVPAAPVPLDLWSASPAGDVRVAGATNPVLYNAEGEICTGTPGPECVLEARATLLPDCKGLSSCVKASYLRVSFEVRTTGAVRNVASTAKVIREGIGSFDIPTDIKPSTAYNLGTIGFIPYWQSLGVFREAPIQQLKNGVLTPNLTDPVAEIGISSSHLLINNSAPQNMFINGHLRSDGQYLNINNGTNSSTLYTPSVFAGDETRTTVGWLDAGEITLSGFATTYGQAQSPAFIMQSDQRLKTDVGPIPDLRERVANLKGVSFVWKNDQRADIGFIAQDVRKVFAELVHTTSDGNLSVEYANMTALLVENFKAIRDQQEVTLRDSAARLTHLRARIQALEAEAP